MASAGDIGLSGLSDKLDKLATISAKASIALDTFVATIDKVLSSLGKQLTQFVNLANPAVVMRFNMALQNAMSAIGRVFIPILEKFTAVIQQIGNAIESLDGPAKKLIAGLAGGAGLLMAFTAISKAASLLLGIFSGGWITVLLKLTAVLAGVVLATGSGQEMLSSLSEILKDVGAVFQEVAAALLPIVKSSVAPILKTLGEVLATVGKALVNVFAALAPAFKAVLEIFGALFSVVGTLIQAITPLLEVILVPLAAIISVIARVIAAVFVPVLEWLARTIKSVAEFIAKIVRWLLSLVGLENNAPSFDPNSKTAQATRQAQMTDIRGIATRAYTQTFGGAAGGVGEHLLTESQKHTGLLQEIRNNTRNNGSSSTTTSTTSPSFTPSQNVHAASPGRTIGRRVRDYQRDVYDRFRSIFGS